MSEDIDALELSKALGALPKPLAGPVFTEADGKVLSLSKLGVRAGLKFDYPGGFNHPQIKHVRLRISYGGFGAGSSKLPTSPAAALETDMPSSLLVPTPGGKLEGFVDFYYTDTQYLTLPVTSVYEIVS